MSSRWRLAAAALLAGLVAGCGCGARECTECPDVSGSWSVNIDSYSLSGQCYWYSTSGSHSGYVTQRPALGPKVEMTLAGRQFTGSLYESNQMILTATSQFVYGGYREDETNTLTINLNADATGFDGTWTTSIIVRRELSRTESCAGSARLSGTRP